MIRRLLFIFSILVPLLAGAGAGAAAPAWAHGTSADADLALAQTMAGAELTVVVRRTEKVPGPVRVDVISHRPAPGMPVALRLHAATVGDRDAGSTAEVRLVAGRPGTYAADLQASRTGPHILELRAGREVTRLPFQLLVPQPASWELTVYGASGIAGLLLIGALVSGALARRLPAVVLSAGAAIAVTVGITAGLLTPPGPAGAAGEAPGRSYAQLAVETSKAPRAGTPLTVRLELYDGATGFPVDDLVAHHAALVHLVVTSEDGGFFRHVHPIRTAPGQWAVRVTTDRPGRHLVHAELERVDSGTQLVSGRFEVAGEPPDAPVEAKSLRAVAGRATPIELNAGPGVQPWLGMAGHLIVRDEPGDFLGHVHEQLSMRQPSAPPPDETVAVYGPRLRFAFSFPKPGRYFAWVQYMRDFEIVTVPYAVDVSEGRPEPQPELDPVTDAGTTYAVTVGFDDAMRTVSIQVEPDARTADVSAVMPGMGHATPAVAATKIAPGRFEARADFFGMKGAWELSVRITGDSGAEIFTFPVNVNE